MIITFVQMLLIVSYVLNVLHPDRVPNWHVSALCCVAVIELLFSSIGRGSNKQ